MKILAYIWLNWIKPIWSKLRWFKYRNIAYPGTKELVFSNHDISVMLKTIYSHYEWTMDNLSELFDSYKPVPYLYSEYRRIVDNNLGERLKDDCDGYHALIYHILYCNGYNVTLLTVVSSPISKSHTMTLYKSEEDGKYYLIDYTNIYSASSIESLINDVSKRYKYKKVYYWNLQSYNYDKSKFYTVKEF